MEVPVDFEEGDLDGIDEVELSLVPEDEELELEESPELELSVEEVEVAPDEAIEEVDEDFPRLSVL